MSKKNFIYGKIFRQKRPSFRETYSVKKDLHLGTDIPSKKTYIKGNILSKKTYISGKIFRQKRPTFRETFCQKRTTFMDRYSFKKDLHLRTDIPSKIPTYTA